MNPLWATPHTPLSLTFQGRVSRAAEREDNVSVSEVTRLPRSERAGRSRRVPRRRPSPPEAQVLAQEGSHCKSDSDTGLRGPPSLTPTGGESRGGSGRVPRSPSRTWGRGGPYPRARARAPRPGTRHGGLGARAAPPRPGPDPRDKGGREAFPRPGGPVLGRTESTRKTALGARKTWPGSPAGIHAATAVPVPEPRLAGHGPLRGAHGRPRSPPAG